MRLSTSFAAAKFGAPTRRAIALLSTVALASVTLVAATFAASPAEAATNAIRDLGVCTQNSLSANDDDSSDEITLPFPINFFGTQHDTAYVNNNGNVTFEQALWSYTPEDLTGPTENAMIAPFFADIDTRASESRQVTYGQDATTFCVNWVEVGYFDERGDKLISAQLVVTDRSAATGVEGDVGLEFNYSDIGWETGEASDGTDGLGGTSVAVGYTAGTGEEGTFTQLQGSLVNGALIDGGPNALVSNSRNSNVLGRYVFNIGGPDIVQEGSLSGTVVDDQDAPVVGAQIQICAEGATGDDCVTSPSSAAGTFNTAGLPVGDYNVTATAATPENGRILFDPVTLPITILAGQTAELDFVLPTVNYSDLAVSVQDVNGAPVEGASVKVCDSDDSERCAGTLETAAEGTAAWAGDNSPRVGEYTIAVIAPEGSGLQNNSATATVVVGENAAVTVTLLPVPANLISGEVRDQNGQLIEGATVTLSSQVGEEFVDVAEGSQWLGSETSTNPQTTSADGAFNWQVVDPTAIGTIYALNAQAETCVAAGVNVDGFNAEGEATVILTLDCAEEPVATEEPTPSDDASPAVPTAPASPDSDVVATTPGGDLAQTGASTLPMALIALTLLGGGGLVLLRRRANKIGA